METAAPASDAPAPDSDSGLFGVALGILSARWKIIAAVVVAIALFIYFFADVPEEGFDEKDADDTTSDPDVMRLVTAINS